MRNRWTNKRITQQKRLIGKLRNYDNLVVCKRNQGTSFLSFLPLLTVLYWSTTHFWIILSDFWQRSPKVPDNLFQLRLASPGSPSGPPANFPSSAQPKQIRISAVNLCSLCFCCHVTRFCLSHDADALLDEEVKGWTLWLLRDIFWGLLSWHCQ